MARTQLTSTKPSKLSEHPLEERFLVKAAKEGQRAADLRKVTDRLQVSQADRKVLQEYQLPKMR